MPRQNYTPEFKAEVVKLVLEQGYSQDKAAQALGVSSTSVHRWVHQWQREHEGETPVGSPAMTPEHQRIQALEAQVRELQRERDILKKSTAFFVKELERSSK